MQECVLSHLIIIMLMLIMMIIILIVIIIVVDKVLLVSSVLSFLCMCPQRATRKSGGCVQSWR